jgi:hypothetical protein
LLELIGQRAAARAAFARIQTDPQLTLLAGGYRALQDGRLAEVADTMGALADELERRAEYWMRYQAADARLLAALGELGLHHDQRARLLLQRTLATLLGTANVNGTTAMHRRRVARVRALLAPLSLATDRAGAIEQASAAAAWYRGAGGYEGQLAELTALLKTWGSR